MAHDDHSHGHGHHHHDHSPEAKEYMKSRKEGGAISRAINDTKARLNGKYFHMHGDHAHAYDVPTGGKIAMVAGSVASLGVAVHGLDNMRKGAFGYEDKALGERYEPSAQRFLVGAGEVAGGLALTKRIATGQWKL